MTPHEIKAKLLPIYRADTAFDRTKWLEATNKDLPRTFGHCAVTAIIIHDQCGGEFVSRMINGESHWFNLIDGLYYDATADQFFPDIYDGIVAVYPQAPEGTRVRSKHQLNKETLQRASTLAVRAGLPVPKICQQGVSNPILVILESPFSGEEEKNVAYARACMKDCFTRGEFPYASHLLYTQPGILNDHDPGERSLGINAGLAWGEKASKTVVYTDLGVSNGMRYGIQTAHDAGRSVEYRRLPSFEWHYDSRAGRFPQVELEEW